MPVSVLFGLTVAGILLLARFSKQHVLQKIGLGLLFAYGASNVAVDFYGFQQAPLMVPTIDAVAAILIAATGYRSHNMTALVVFGIYAIVGLVHVGAFVLKMQATYTYYLTLNLLFLAQLLIVGGVSAGVVLRDRVPARDQRLGSHHPRWPNPA